jgi:hypothetical protein
MKKRILMFAMIFLLVLSVNGSSFEFVNDVITQKKILGQWNVEGIAVEFTSQLVSTARGINFYRFKENNSIELVYSIMKEKKDRTSFLGVGRLVNGEMADGSNGFNSRPSTYSIHLFGNDHVVFDNGISDARDVLKAVRIKSNQVAAVSKSADIEEFISLTGQSYIKDTIDSLNKEVRKKFANVPEEAWKGIAATKESRIMDLLIPIYGKYFLQSEIREMNAFFKGAAWPKYLRVVKSIGDECLAAGKKFKEDTFLSVEKQLKSKGYLK